MNMRQKKDKEKSSKTYKDINIVDLKQELAIQQAEKDRYIRRKERLFEKKKFISYKHIEERISIEQEICLLQKKIEEKDREIYLLNKTKKTIEEAINNMGSLEKKVFYAHRYLGKSLVEIAIELGHDYGYIRNISSKADKKMR